MANQTDLRAAAARLLYSDNRDTADYNMLIEFIDSTFRENAEQTQTMTNADRIRAMSDEDLAVVIMCPMEIGACKELCEKNPGYTCVECSLQWLRDPAEEVKE